jgi:extracellular factor (EF) 3-hydroxypalmitic acid methyl ester biosynthesis protein
MEVIGDWKLIHRNPEQLIRLGRTAKFDSADIQVRQEPDGVNLFLHLKIR